jgi:hypothetical protein
MSNAQFTGVATIRKDGVSMRSKEGATLEMGGFERSPVFGDGVFLGYRQKPKEARLKATFQHLNLTDVDDINDTVDSTMRFECDSGVTYIMRNAVSGMPPTLGDQDQGLSCEFFGARPTKQ